MNMDNNVVVSDYAAMDCILRDERKYILNMCKKIKKSGANVVLIQKSILRDAYNELDILISDFLSLYHELFSAGSGRSRRLFVAQYLSAANLNLD